MIDRDFLLLKCVAAIFDDFFGDDAIEKEIRRTGDAEFGRNVLDDRRAGRYICSDVGVLLIDD